MSIGRLIRSAVPLGRTRDGTADGERPRSRRTNFFPVSFHVGRVMAHK